MNAKPGFGARIKLLRQRFRQWRRTRPFWAGVFTLLAGFNFAAPLAVPLHIGTAVVSTKLIVGPSALLIGGVMILCGLSLWVRKEFRFAAGVITMILALVGLVTANLGSLVVGTLLGLIGGGLAIAWSDRSPRPTPVRPAGRHASAAGEG